MTVKKAVKTKEPKQPKGQSIRKEFEINLTDKECKTMSRKAFELELEAHKVGLEFEEAKDAFKAKINAALAKAADIRAKVYKEFEIKTLDAIMYKDYDSKEIRYLYKGKVIEKRTMTPEECQVHMDELNPKKAEKVKVLKTRDAGKAIAQVSGKKAKDDSIADVIRMETGRKTKTSSVDGAVRS